MSSAREQIEQAMTAAERQMMFDSNHALDYRLIAAERVIDAQYAVYCSDTLKLKAVIDAKDAEIERLKEENSLWERKVLRFTTEAKDSLLPDEQPLWGESFISVALKSRKIIADRELAAEAECAEQARLVGMGAKREAGLRGEIERLKAANESYYADANAQQRLAIKMQSRAEAAEAERDHYKALSDDSERLYLAVCSERDQSRDELQTETESATKLGDVCAKALDRADAAEAERDQLRNEIETQKMLWRIAVSRADAAEAECAEQARLVGMGAEREAGLRGEIERLQKRVDDYHADYVQAIDECCYGATGLSDAQHCTCVAPMRIAIKKLSAERDQLRERARELEEKSKAFVDAADARLRSLRSGSTTEMMREWMQRDYRDRLDRIFAAYVMHRQGTMSCDFPAAVQQCAVALAAIDAHCAKLEDGK
jgi:hypothetical protein